MEKCHFLSFLTVLFLKGCQTELKILIRKIEKNKQKKYKTHIVKTCIPAKIKVITMGKYCAFGCPFFSAYEKPAMCDFFLEELGPQEYPNYKRCKQCRSNFK